MLGNTNPKPEFLGIVRRKGHVVFDLVVHRLIEMIVSQRANIMGLTIHNRQRDL